MKFKNRREEWVELCDRGLEGILAILLFTLPINRMGRVKGAAIVLAALLWVAKSILLRRWVFSRTRADLPIFLFFLWSLFTITTAADPFYSFREVKNEVLTQIFFFYLIVSNFGKREVGRLLNALFASAALLSIIGIVEFFRTGGAFLAPVIRVHSLTSDYIFFSTYLALTIPFILNAAIQETRSPLRRWGYGVLLTLSMVALYFTFTRAAWLAVFLAFLLYTLFQNRRLFLGFSAASICAGLLVLTFIPRSATLAQTVSNLSRTQDIPRRMEQWRFDLEVVKEHPWVGIGYGRESLKKSYPNQTTVNEEWWHTFNMFFGVAVGLGLPGFFIFLWMLSVLFREIWRRISSLPSDRAGLCAAALSVLFGFLLRNWFDDVYAGAPALLFWIFMALVLASDRNVANEGVRATR